jgi:outer membrane immunogenic protein
MCKNHEFAAVFYFRNSLHPSQLLVLFKRAFGDASSWRGTMKLSRSLAVAGAVLAGTAAAQAADMALKAPPVVAAPFSWAGPYIGVNLGAVSGNANYDPICAGAITAACPVLIPATLQNIPGIGLLIIPGAFSGLPGGSARDTSFMGGVQAGYNWQVNQIVLGVEGDIDGTHIHASLTRGAIPPFAGLFPVAVTATSTDTVDWIASARARAGVVVAERGLLYVTGGAAFTNAKVNTAFGETFGPLVIPPFLPPPAGASSSHGLVGWTLGGGVEWAFSKAWSLAAEYRHNDFGGQNYLLGTDVVGTPIMDRVKFTTDQVTLRVNWRFAAH